MKKEEEINLFTSHIHQVWNRFMWLQMAENVNRLCLEEEAKKQQIFSKTKKNAWNTKLINKIYFNIEMRENEMVMTMMTKTKSIFTEIRMCVVSCKWYCAEIDFFINTKRVHTAHTYIHTRTNQFIFVLSKTHSFPLISELVLFFQFQSQNSKLIHIREIQK